MSERLLVDEARLWTSIMDMGRVGALPHGGCSRTSLSAADFEGRRLFVGWANAAGCAISFDQVGNIYARRPGRNASRPAVATGSHLDTQPHGGKFDGIYGVLAGLEVVRVLNAARIETEAPIDVVVWTNEEGVRFRPPLAGSSAFSGKVDVATIHAAATLDGTTVGQDLEASGFLGSEVPGARRFDCFIEAHIEQGPILESEGKTIGVVTQVQGIRWMLVTVIGRDSHAGTTPMHLRHDALLGAARMLDTLNRMACAQDAQARLTVGRLVVEPNSGATIPGKVTFVCDLRHPKADVLDDLGHRMQQAIRRIAVENGLEAEIERVLDIPPVYFATELTDIIRTTAKRFGYGCKDMLSGAGHDAMNVAKIAPAAMIFVPCKGGLSHNEAESAAPADLAAGANTLLHTLLARANP